MRLHRTWLAAMLAVGLIAPAQAQMNVYYHVSAWDAFDGPGDNGLPICGIGSRSAADGRSFSMRFQIGGDTVAFMATKTGWNIPDGTQIPVVMQVGLERPWTQQAVGHGDRVQWTLDRVNAQLFDGQFRSAVSMTVTFPSGSEPPWVISLSGSTAASNAMHRCVTDLTQRAAAAQPAAPPAPAAPSATQPFGTTPGAPANPAADQSAPQDQQGQSGAAPSAPAPAAANPPDDTAPRAPH